jgi:hypothetical protein
MAATLDGMVEPLGAVFEAKFMLPWAFSEEAAAEKHMAQLQHNMWVTNSCSAVLSIITGGGKWVELTVHADPPLPTPPPYRREEVLALRPEWRAASPVRGRATQAPARGGLRRRHECIQQLGGMDAVYRKTRAAHQEHEGAKGGLKKLLPEDAREAIGHGLRAKRSKSGAVSLHLVDEETADAPLQ